MLRYLWGIAANLLFPCLAMIIRKTTTKNHDSELNCFHDVVDFLLGIFTPQVQWKLWKHCFPCIFYDCYGGTFSKFPERFYVSCDVNNETAATIKATSRNTEAIIHDQEKQS